MHSPVIWPGSTSRFAVTTLGFFQLFEHAMFLQLQVPYCFLKSSPHESPIFTDFACLTPEASALCIISLKSFPRYTCYTIPQYPVPAFW